MSPFEPHAHDPNGTDHLTSPRDVMACSPPAADACGSKEDAGDALQREADEPPTTASTGEDGTSAKPRPQTSDPASPGKVTFAASGGDSSEFKLQHSPQTTERIAPLAEDTATGLRSPLRAASENELQRSSSTSRFKKYLPGKHGAPVHLHADHSQATTPQVDSYAISKIGQAREKVKRSFDRSKLLEKDEFVFPRFELDELTLGKILGKGGFGTVLEIMEMETADPEEEQAKNEEMGISLSGAVTEKSGVFRIDDLHGAGKRGRRRKSHSFRLRRPHHHGVHGIHPHFSLRFSHSHDGCEGSSPGGGLMSIRERESFERGSLEVSKSHDGVTGDGAVTGSVDGTKKQRRLRAKSLPWKTARSAVHDVSHFFHWNPRHQQSEGEGEGGPMGEHRLGTPGDEMQDQSDRVGTVLQEGHCNEKCEEQVNEDELALKDESGTTGISERSGGVMDDGGVAGLSERSGVSQRSRRVRRVSRNFSFRSWRDSEAGEEGNDALSLEELEKYNIDMNFFSTSRNNSFHSMHTESDHRLDINDLAIETKEVESSGRRIVMFSTPKEGVSLRGDAREDNHSGHQDKTYITHHATNNEGEARYVIKIISQDIVETDFRKFLQAAMDMATETYFLSVISHPHILKLRAVGQGDMFSPNYFLVLDRLYDTLSDRIEGSWKQQQDHLENSFLVWNRSWKLRNLWEERMSVMKDLASALAHLHEMNIIYRDLKGENVGFDSQGNVKLFDFGLAKEVHEEDECANGTYKLTPNTGSIRYMAPENGNKWPYSSMVDSYSFAILLWEVAALERPFAAYTPREIRDLVMKWGERPKIREGWPGWSDRVVGLMTNAWDSNFRKRPSMRTIEETLEKEIQDTGI